VRSARLILVPIALSGLAALLACSGEVTPAEADIGEFRRVAETYQQLYMDGGENCDRIVAVLADDIRMIENGEAWSHEQMEKYCPYLPRKEIISSWSDLAVLAPDRAYDFVTSVYRVGENAPGRETVARVWRKIGGQWKIVRMSSARGPVPAPSTGG
jgi:hypothetical protein